MTEEHEPTINIVVSAKGVKVVQFCGEGWDDETETARIYQQIKHLIQQIDRALKANTVGSDVVH